MTGKEIRDLAEFVGFTVSSCNTDDTTEDMLETEISIEMGGSSGLLDDDGITRRHYKYVACFYEYPEEGYIGLGEELS